MAMEPISLLMEICILAIIRQEDLKDSDSMYGGMDHHMLVNSKMG